MPLAGSLGPWGVWSWGGGATLDRARVVEALGYSSLWVGGSPAGDLTQVDALLEATTTLTVATGIVNVWKLDARRAAAAFHRIEAAHPGRFVLGIGIGHPEADAVYRSPYQSLVDYLDVLDAEGVPADQRMLAALGPRVLRLAGARTLGAHPYLTTPEHTAAARAILGAGPVLVPEQKAVLDTDADRARTVGRTAISTPPYLQLTNYRRNLVDLGFAEADLDDGGSDAVIDALIAHGTADQIADRLRAHRDAGADAVLLQASVGAGDPLPVYEAVAKALGL